MLDFLTLRQRHRDLKRLPLVLDRQPLDVHNIQRRSLLLVRQVVVRSVRKMRREMIEREAA
jgi:hypothetical protein